MILLPILGALGRSKLAEFSFKLFFKEAYVDRVIHKTLMNRPINPKVKLNSKTKLSISNINRYIFQIIVGKATKPMHIPIKPPTIVDESE